MKTIHFFFLAISFAVVGVIFMGFYAQPLTPTLAARQVSSQLEEELKGLETEITLFQKQLLDCDQVSTVRFPIYVYRDKQLHCWTDNKLLPPINLVSDSSSVQLVRIAQSNFVLYQRPLQKGVQVVSLLMLTREYPIQNDFLTSEWNERLFPTNAITILESSSNLGVPVVYNEQTVFRISFLLSGLSAYPQANDWSVFFLFSALLLLTITLNRIFQSRFPRSLSLFLLCSWLIAIRFLLLAFSYPRDILPIELFSPTQFASSWFNPSLGDLGINVLVILIISISIFRYATPLLVTKDSREPDAIKVIGGVFLAFFLFSAAHYPILTIQTIAHNSNIDFGITSSLDFSIIRIVSLSTLLVTWCSAFLLIHVFVKFILLKCGKQAHRILLVGALLFSGVNYWENQPFVPTLFITWVLILLIHYFDHLSSLDRIQYKTFSYLFLMLIAFVLNVSMSIYFLSNEKNRSNQLRFAESYLSDRDTFGEFLLNDLSKKIEDDVFIQTRLISPFLSKLPIQQKIRQVYLPSYFNKYDVRILLFNSIGNSLEENGPSSFSEFITQVDEDSNGTEYDGVYRIHKRKQNVAQQYVLVKAIKRNGFLNGYIVVELSLKKSVPDNVYPELLVDNRFRESLRPANLSYATFVKGTVESQAGDFDYEKKFEKDLLGDQALYHVGIEAGGYQHVAVEDADQVITVISTRPMSLRYFLTNASFYLVLGLVLVLLLIGWLGIVNYLGGRQLYYAARIQLLINLSFFLPLVIVSMVTLRMLSKSSQDQLNTTYLDRAIFLTEQWNLQYVSGDSIMSDRDEESYLQHLARVSNTELFLYERNGLMKGASHRALFDNHLLAPLANAEALIRMRANESSFIVPEQVGGLSFFVVYARLKVDDNYLAIPYYQSATLVERLQIEALADILVIFVFVFILLLISSFFVARWLTFPLRFISDTLQRTTLEQPNKPLQWNANDEIGLMVKSYNDMLQKLKDSKTELERMQREQAWREIAQQVAHEIKNPLTPMKLTLQRLARSVRNKEAIPEQMSGSIDSMLEQVEVLNTIASSFSTFAKLPRAQVQVVNLRPALDKVCELYNLPTSIQTSSPTEVLALADPVIIQTIFSNILVNAIQAKHEDRELLVKISIEKREGFWHIFFEDNGKGIDKEKADKIFLPHFSTKETGSGLGLAIAKRGVEQLLGTISFTSVLHEGTTFRVTIPTAD